MSATLLAGAESTAGITHTINRAHLSAAWCCPCCSHPPSQLLSKSVDDAPHSSYVRHGVERLDLAVVHRHKAQ